jgi:hypothetical protein
MGTLFGSLKDKLLAKLITSLLPKYVLKYEVDVRKIVISVNMLILALNIALPTLPEAKVKKELDFITGKWRSLISLVEKYIGIKFSDN